LHVPLVIRRWPFVPVAVLLIGGIVLARFGGIPNLVVMSVSAGAVALAFARNTRLVGIAIGILAAGMLHYTARYRIASPEDLRIRLTPEPALVTVRGRIIQTPSLRDFYSGTNSIAYSHSVIEVSGVSRNKEWISASGKVASRTRGALTTDFVEHRQVEVTGVIEQPPNAHAPGLFDYRAYLHNQRIFFQLKSDSTNDWQLLTFEPVPLTERFRRWAQHQLQRGLPHDEQLDLILAMTLGLRRALSGEASEPFMRTGTMHIFAVSGLHVACIAGFILYALQWCGLSREKAGLLTVPLIWFYTLATGWQSSAIRAALMFTVIIAGRILKRPSDLLNSTAAAAVLILLFQPEQVFQAGFQLSFTVVAGLALLLPTIQRLHLKFLDPDPFLPRSAWPRWRLLAAPLGRLTASMFAVSVASWIGSTPLIAYYFNMVTLSSFAANLVAVPLSSVALASTVFSILLWPAGPFFNYLSWVFMWYTIEFTRLCAEIPLGYFYVPKPNWLFFVFYFATAAVVFIPAFRAPTRRIVTFPTLALLGMAWICSILIGRPIATITILQCAGTPALVQVENEPTLLVDVSSERDSGYMLKRFIHSRGLGSIDHLLLTHGDAQNVGGFQTIWEEFEPGLVITSSTRARSPVYRQTIRLLENSPSKWKIVSTGERFNGWTILHPPEGRGLPRADDNSVVMKRALGHCSILHVGDLGGAGQKQLLASGADLDADVVIAGMPERDEPLGDELLQAISPRAIILGNSRYPHHAEGTPELRARIEQTGAKIFYMTETDAVTIRIDHDECAISGMNGTETKLRRPVE
jgi:competence protein ComEC